eukprot:6195200-Pleurochrysis_carterae.AAC.1
MVSPRVCSLLAAAAAVAAQRPGELPRAVEFCRVRRTAVCRHNADGAVGGGGQGKMRMLPVSVRCSLCACRRMHSATVWSAMD